jgi:glycosyltransferase involved in cell wall biosynthesis
VSHAVAIVTRFYRPYVAGAEVQAERLARYVASSGGACEVVTTRYRSDLRRSEAAGGVQVRRLATGGRWLTKPVEFLRALAYFLLNANRFAVVHAYCLSPFTLGALVGSRIRGVPTILVACTIGANGDITRVKRSLGGAVLWRLYMAADVLVAQSEVARDDLLLHGALEDKVLLLPHMATPAAQRLPTTAERSAARMRIGLPDRPTVLYVGRLESAKGIDSLLEAWPEVVAARDAQLVLVGDGPLREQAMATGSTLARPDSLQVVGWHADPKPFYEASDIFVFPSESETFGVALADAMAYGLAIIATPTGLTRGWVRDQEDGVIIPPKDAAAIRAALSSLLADSSRRRDLGERARQRASETFSVEAVGARYSALCDRLSAGEPVKLATDLG